jgi:hypothetical protein
VRRLRDFGEAEASSAEAFHLRVGLFGVLGKSAREEILARRENSLDAREQRLAAVEENMELGRYGGEVVRFMRREILTELGWIDRLRKLSGLRNVRRTRQARKEAM